VSWLGKILGGGIGLMVGGPIGAVFGAVLGHHAMDARTSTVENRQGIYFVGTFSMLGKIAKADGVVTAQEVEAIERVMRDNLRLSAASRDFAISIFNAARDSDDSFEDYARQFVEVFGDSPEILTSIIELLLHVAYADGELHDTEEQMIRSAARIFGVDTQYVEMRSLFSGQVTDINQCYAILGAEQGESLPAIKKKYRKLAMEHHPDRLQSRGLPPEFVTESEEKFKEIQQAYDSVEKHLS
jgi:DnaJ like chaperone protein